MCKRFMYKHILVLAHICTDAKDYIPCMFISRNIFFGSSFFLDS